MDPVERALDRFDRLMDRRCDVPGARFAKAIVLAGASRHRDAAAGLGQLLEEVAPPFPELLRLGLSRCLRSLGDPGRALGIALGVAEQLPDTVSVDIEIARNLMSLGRLAEARSRLEAAIIRCGELPSRIALVLCLCSVLKALDLPDEGVRVCDAALTERLPKPGLLARRADFLILMGRFDEAEHDLDRALHDEPAIAAGQANRGLLHLVAGQVGQARARFALAGALDPRLKETCETWWRYDGQQEALFP